VVILTQFRAKTYLMVNAQIANDAKTSPAVLNLVLAYQVFSLTELKNRKASIWVFA